MQHQVEKREGLYHCTICEWDWRAIPESNCPGVRRVEFSHNHLLSFTQLREKGLKPADRNKPDACYYRSSKKDFVWLYDEQAALPRKGETPAQREARARTWLAIQEKYRCPQCNQTPRNLANLKEFRPGGLLCRECEQVQAWEDEARMIEQAGREACEWAAALLQRDDWCILDTETTDLGGYIVEVAVIAPDGAVLLNTVVNPQHPVSKEARRIHRITDEEIVAAPTLPDVWPAFVKALAGRSTIIAFNAAFDSSILQYDAKRYNLALPDVAWDCLMLEYAAWVGEWSDYHNDFKYQPLPDGSHRALGDTQVSLKLLHAMADSLKEFQRQDILVAGVNLGEEKAP